MPRDAPWAHNGSLRPWLAGAAAFGLLAVAAFAVGHGPARASGPPGTGASGPPLPLPAAGMRFGIDAAAVPLLAAAGIAPDYGTIWIGVWNLREGWLGPDAQLRALADSGVTPAIHLYYWGDDLRPECLAVGCNGKTVAEWDRLARELVEHLAANLGGADALIVLETEFNKASVATHEPLDALLAQKATALKEGYPAARVALGFGGWNLDAWPTWDRAAAAADLVGVQALSGGAGSGADAEALFDRTLEGARRLDALFGKPVILQDVAVASHPGPATPESQRLALAPFLDGALALRAAGVQAILYRSYLDAPGMSADHHFGEAERHFGLATASPVALKPAGEVWLEAMAAARPAPAGPTGPARPAA